MWGDVSEFGAFLEHPASLSMARLVAKSIKHYGNHMSYIVRRIVFDVWSRPYSCLNSMKRRFCEIFWKSSGAP